jgi:Protein of unknown function (DUF1264)
LYNERETNLEEIMLKHLFTIAVSLSLAQFAAAQTESQGGAAEKNWPTAALHAHVCGIHFYSGDMKRQIIAEHYCSHWTDEILQCIIYDSNKPNARLIGVEYIVSAKIFESLPAEEKKLWHSHNYEVKSGVLTAPEMADSAEKDLLKVLIGTYGKTWHMWQVDRGDKIPMGIPQLMMAFTKDGQASASIIAERDKLYGPSPAKKSARADIADFKVDPAADGWQKGQALQLDLKTVTMSGAAGTSTQ